MTKREAVALAWLVPMIEVRLEDRTKQSMRFFRGDLREGNIHPKAPHVEGVPLVRAQKFRRLSNDWPPPTVASWTWVPVGMLNMRND